MDNVNFNIIIIITSKSFINSNHRKFRTRDMHASSFLGFFFRVYTCMGVSIYKCVVRVYHLVYAHTQGAFDRVYRKKHARTRVYEYVLYVCVCVFV